MRARPICTDLDLINSIISFRLDGIPVKEIAQNVNKPFLFVRNILNKNNIRVSKEVMHENSYKAKLKKNPNHMQDMVNKQTPESTEARIISMKETYGKNKDEIVEKIQNSRQWYLDETKGKFTGINSCSRKKILKQNGVSCIEELMERYAKEHGGSFIGPYVHSKEKTWWECKKGHKFSTTPNQVQQGQWCSRCSHKTSKGQQEVFDYVVELFGKENILMRNWKVLGNRELDIYIPFKKVGIEYNGLFWHCDGSPGFRINWSFKKFRDCLDKDVRLLTIYEDEWQNPNKKLIWQNIIKRKMNLFDVIKLDEKDLTIKKIEFDNNVIGFLNKFSLDLGHEDIECGFVYGIFYKAKLISCCIIEKNQDNEYEIIRFVTDYNYSIEEGNVKLIEYICNDIKGLANKLYGKSDNRYSLGSMYKELGFVEVSDIDEIGYYFTDYFVRYLKCGERPLFKIEDCGHRKWVKYIK